MLQKEIQALREELYGLMGRLPGRNNPMHCKVVSVEDRGNYILECLILTVETTADEPRCEPIPAYFVRPKGEGVFPAVLFNHSHGGQYHIGKDELLGPAS